MDGVRHDYTYASGQLLRESFTQGGTAYTLDFLYDPDGRPYLLYLTTTTGSTTVSAPYYYILNLQGDVIHLVNTSGAAVASYTYDPYGSPLTATGSLATVNPLRYRGYYYDPETGFYYLQSRYYDPALGRFLNADSYTSTGTGFLGYNMFAYCENRPIIGCDPNGEFLFTAILIGVAVGAAIDYGCQVYENVKDGQSGSDAFLKNINWGSVFASGFSGGVSAVPGGGLVAACVDIVGSAVIEETVNGTISACKGEGFKWNWKNVGGNIIKNTVDKVITSKAASIMPTPNYIRDIKSSAMKAGVKGTKKLTKYLNKKIVTSVAVNVFSENVFKKGVRILFDS